MASIPGIFNSVKTLVPVETATKTPQAASSSHPLIKALAADPHAAATVPAAPSHGLSAGSADTGSADTGAGLTAAAPVLAAVAPANATLGAPIANFEAVLDQTSTSGAVRLGFTATLGGAGHALLAATLTGAATDSFAAPQADLQVVQVHGGATVTFQSAESFMKSIGADTSHHG